MSLEGNYSFAGIGAAEAKDRENEHRVGTPPKDRPLALLAVALKYLTGVRVMNQGSAAADVRLAHGSGTKTQTGELMTAFGLSATQYQGRLQFGSVVPGSVSTAAAAGPGALTDDGNGLLLDGGGVQRGTIDYVKGLVVITFAGAVTELVTITYQHNDWQQFAIAQSQIATAGGAYPEEFTTQFGRAVPGTVTLTDGVLTFADDGKGNMVETGAGFAVSGSIDYATGLIELTTGSAPLSAVADAVTITYQFNPFGAIAAAGGGQSRLPLLPGALPEFDNEAWADGVKGETEVALIGESRDPNLSTNLVTYWAHHVGDDQGFRVREIYTGFPPGGATNDPRIDEGF